MVDLGSLPNKDILEKLCVPKELWPSHILRKEESDGNSGHKKKEYALQPELSLPEPKPVLLANGSVAPVAACFAVKTWFNANPNTRMSLQEFADFWSSLTDSDKRYISLRASEATKLPLKEDIAEA